MAYFKAVFDTKADGVLTGSVDVIISYDGTQYTCAQIEAYLASLTDEQRLVWRNQSLTEPPPPPSGYKAQARDCSTQQFDVTVTTDNSGAP
ncbi:hypothetical protein [Spirosoma sp.]|uniref:hypothetical protein n=1 Tax=Spirosoma sp. TaxID=1899569 RepID=UPI00262A5C6B|nr:hypothetical protein [Spirosoma sp.]MCX6218333.1 hypothetical protein [Spirosoma sp.]